MDDKNPAMDDGWTPLHFSARYGHLEVFNFITENVQDKSPETNDGFTPQQLAHKWEYFLLIPTSTAKLDMDEN